MSIGPLDSTAVDSYRETGAGLVFPVTISTAEEASPSATPSVTRCAITGVGNRHLQASGTPTLGMTTARYRIVSGADSEIHDEPHLPDSRLTV